MKTDENPAAADPHESVYDNLLAADINGWAFGATGPDQYGDDPLSGVDASVPSGIDAPTLATYALMLGDDALIMSHRLSGWCSWAPDLEEDVALSNIALDLLGQARLLLARAAAADPSLVPAMPAGSSVPAEDALAFFRDEQEFRNVCLAESDNGDFARTITGLLVFTVWRLEIFTRLQDSRDAVLAAVATKGIKEMTYHRDYAARWFVTLAGGTDESRRRIEDALALVWPFAGELFASHPVECAAAQAAIGVDPADVQGVCEDVFDTVFAAAGLDMPAGGVATPARSSQGLDRPEVSGRSGIHTHELALLLAEMQVVAREHPMGRW